MCIRDRCIKTHFYNRLHIFGYTSPLLFTNIRVSGDESDIRHVAVRSIHLSKSVPQKYQWPRVHISQRTMAAALRTPSSEELRAVQTTLVRSNSVLITVFKFSVICCCDRAKASTLKTSDLQGQSRHFMDLGQGQDVVSPSNRLCPRRPRGHSFKLMLSSVGNGYVNTATTCLSVF